MGGRSEFDTNSERMRLSAGCAHGFPRDGTRGCRVGASGV